MNDTTATTPDFSQRIGEVIRVSGTTIDASFTGSTHPPLMGTVQIEDGNRAITAFVSQFLDDDVARLMVLDGSTDRRAINPGARIAGTGRAADRPLNRSTIQQIVTDAGEKTRGSRIETGIKVIDLFAPIVRHGTVAIVGDKNVGKLVVVDELLHRLREAEAGVTILVFLRTPDETGAIFQLEYRTIGALTVIGIPVADASLTALGSLLERVDTVFVMNRRLGEQKRYPAIDPVHSRSRAATDSAVAGEARSLLQAESNEDRRTDLIRAYLTQPFFVAEPWTNRPGAHVSMETANSDLERLLYGDIDQLTEDDLAMDGSLEHL
jgi:F0F1-type ATP synthase beta subunit